MPASAGLGIVALAPWPASPAPPPNNTKPLSAQGNQFGADALLHRYEGRTAGGVVDAFAGEKIATIYNEHQINHPINHPISNEGVIYADDKMQWVQTEHAHGLNSYDLPTIKATSTPAKAAHLSTLDYHGGFRVGAGAAGAAGHQKHQAPKRRLVRHTRGLGTR